MKLAFIIDPIAKLDPAHDTSVALMEAACRTGHAVFITNMNTLSVKDGKAWAFLQSTKIYPVPLVDGKWQVPNPWYEVAEGKFQPRGKNTKKRPPHGFLSLLGGRVFFFSPHIFLPTGN